MGGPISDTTNSVEANIQHVCKCDMDTWSLQCTCSVPPHRLYLGELLISTVWENYSICDQLTSGQSEKRSLYLLAWILAGSVCAGFHSSWGLKLPISQIQPLSFRFEQLLASKICSLTALSRSYSEASVFSEFVLCYRWVADWGALRRLCALLLSAQPGIC